VRRAKRDLQPKADVQRPRASQWLLMSPSVRRTASTSCLASAKVSCGSASLRVFTARTWSDGDTDRPASSCRAQVGSTSGAAGRGFLSLSNMAAIRCDGGDHKGGSQPVLVQHLADHHDPARHECECEGSPFNGLVHSCMIGNLGVPFTRFCANWLPSSNRAPRGYLLSLSRRLGSGQARVRCSVGRSPRGCPPGGCGSSTACVLAGCRGEAWLKKGLRSSK